MRKPLAIAFVFIMIATVLTACEGSKPLEKPKSQQTKESTATPAPTNTKEISAGAFWSAVGGATASVEQSNTASYDLTSTISVGPKGSVGLIASINNWSSIETGAANLYGLTYATKDVCYACGNDGQVIKSINGGKNFSQMTRFGESEPNQCQMMSFCDENNGIIASPKTMAITKDGATTWSKINIPSGILAV